MTSSRETSTLSELLAHRDTLVLSPHMDDAMLSASAVVLDHACNVWTVFTGAPEPAQTTSWDVSCGFVDSDATISARKVEDEKAFAGTPARTRHLDALEGAYATREQHRAALPALEAEIDAWMTEHPEGVVVAPACAGLHMPPPIWAPVLAFARTARGRLIGDGGESDAPGISHGDAEPASPAAASAAADTNPASAHTVSPQPAPPHASASRRASAPKRVATASAHAAKGLAQRALHAEHLWRRRRTMGEDGLAANPDHLALRDLTLRVAERHPDVQIVLFEDLPYLWHARGDDEVGRLERGLGLRTRRISEPVDRARKHEHLAAYVSQLPVLDRQGRLMQASQLPGQEVFWVVEDRFPGRR